MGILPVNETKPTVDTPHNFFIYGETMSGKSYLAERFPNPLFLNTDGNARANPAPSIQLKNERDMHGKLKTSVLTQLDQIILELQNLNDQKQFGYQTIIVDVIDDVCQLVEQAVCIENNVRDISDIAWGKGFNAVKSVISELVTTLKGMPVNVVYISRVNYEGENKVEKPSLKGNYYNIVNGNCDLVIHTQKFGNVYKRSIESKRKKYYASKIDDKHILQILKAISGAISPEEEAKKPDAIERAKQAIQPGVNHGGN